MNSTTTPLKCLEIVKSKGDDNHAKIIKSRMGLNVADFMNCLNSAESKFSFHSDQPRGFIWPKHTPLEILDQTSIAYQRDSSDCSWSLRFRALGYYSVPTPTPDTAHSSPHGENQLLDFSNQTLHRLLNSTLEPPPGTPSQITPTQHNQLEEDLKLSESEDEANLEDMDETKPMLESDGPLDLFPQEAFSQPSSTELADHVPVQKSIVNVIKRSPKVPSLAETVDPLENAFTPFVSPLSTVADLLLPGGASFVNDVVIFSQTETSTSVLCPTSVCLSSSANLESGLHSSSAYHPAASIPSFSTTHPNNSALIEFDRNSFNCPSADIPGYSDPEAWTTVHSSRYRKKSLSVAVASGTQGSCVNSLLHPPGCLQSNRIRQLVLESEAVLATAEKCFVKNLSPDSLSYWKMDTAVSVVDKENCALRDDTVVDIVLSKRLNSEVNGSKLGSLRHEYHSSPVHPVLEVSPLRSCDAAAFSEASSTTCTSFTRGNPFVAFGSLTNSCEVPTFDRRENLTINKLELLDTVRSSSLHVYLSKTHQTPVGDRPGTTTLTASSHGLCEHSLVTLPIARESPSHLSIGIPDKSEKCLESIKHMLPIDNGFATNETAVLPNSHSTETPCLPVKPSHQRSMPPPESSSRKLKFNETRLLVSDAQSSSPPSTRETTPLITPTISPVSRTTELRLMDQTTTHLDATTVSHKSRISDSRLSSLSSSLPVLRSLPQKRWIFTGISITKVRFNLHSVTQQSGTNGFSQSDLEQFRSILDPPRCPISLSHGDVASRKVKVHSRSLTGVLLVPPELPSSDPAFQSFSKSHLVDASTMTPAELPTFVPRVDVSTQCTREKAQLNSSLSPRVPSCGHVLSLSASGDCPPSSGDRRCFAASTDKSTSLSRSDAIFSESLGGCRLRAEMEKRIPETTVETELHLSELHKTKASRCWKSLVSAISTNPAVTADTHLDSRYRLLYTSDELHQYPVELLQVVRHLITAAHLLEFTGDLLKAADALSEASDHLSHLSQRMKRVEAKLTKGQLKHHSCADTTFGTKLEVRALQVKHDVAWMHLWYYTISRLQSIIHFHDLRLRQLASATLRTQVAEDLSKLGVDVRFIYDGEKNSSNGTVTLPSVLFQRIIHLIQLEKMTHQALATWDHSEQMAAELPEWLPTSQIEPAPGNSSHPSHLIGDRISGLAACSALYGLQTSTGSLLSFMDSILEVHNLLIGRLKSNDSFQLGPSKQLYSDSTHLDKPKSPIRENLLCASQLVTKFKEPVGNNSSGNDFTSLKHVHDHQPVKCIVASLTKENSAEGLCREEKRGKSVKRRLLQSVSHTSAVDKSPMDASSSIPENTEAGTVLTRHSHSDTHVLREKISCSASQPNKLRRHVCSPPSQHHKTKRFSELSERGIGSAAKLYSHETSTVLDNTSPDIHPNEMRHNPKVSRRVSSKTVTTASGYTPFQNTVPSDNPTLLSPASLRTRPRCKSLAPFTANRAVKKEQKSSAENKRSDHGCEPVVDSHLEDRISQPKRARTSGFKNRDSLASCTNSDPCETPSIPVRQLSISHIPSSRKVRSASVGRGLLLSPASINCPTKESIGYSPTKQIGLIDSTVRRIDSDHQESIPVYRVSRISNSPGQTVNCGSTAFKPPMKSGLDGVLAPSSTKNLNRDGVPYFYQRWKNEPLYPNSQNKSAKQDHADG